MAAQASAARRKPGQSAGGMAQAANSNAPQLWPFTRPHDPLCLNRSLPRIDPGPMGSRKNGRASAGRCIRHPVPGRKEPRQARAAGRELPAPAEGRPHAASGRRRTPGGALGGRREIGRKKDRRPKHAPGSKHVPGPRLRDDSQGKRAHNANTAEQTHRNLSPAALLLPEISTNVV